MTEMLEESLEDTMAVRHWQASTRRERGVVGGEDEDEGERSVCWEYSDDPGPEESKQTAPYTMRTGHG
jgi:hypothetical protein